jgi:signal transduction histidine kinase
MLDAIRDGTRPDAGGLRRDLAAAAEAARSVVGSIRRAIYDLHPMSLEELGFSAAVRVVLERQVRRGVETHMAGLDAADRLPATDRTSAFRIVQEAIANAARHSGAARIVVSGRERAGAVELEVADDGVGFDPETVRTPIDHGHLGFAAMRERAVLTGAQLEIESAPGRGTRVRARFPLAAA